MCQQCVKQLKAQFPNDIIHRSVLMHALNDLPKCPAMRALEDLTPSGSEFVEEPKRCYTHVRERLTHQWELLKSKIIELKNLQSHKDDNLELIGRTCKHCGKQYNGTAFGMCSQCGRFQ
jgi:hypothetical protein